MKRKILWALAFGVSLLPAGEAAAQGRSGKEAYADEHHRNDCRLAHQVLTLGQPTNRRGWALHTAPTCGALGGEALAAELGRHRRAAADLPNLEALVFAASRLTDASVFHAGLALGGDPAAGTAARIAGWRIALHQLVPGSYARTDEGVDGEPVELASASSAAPLAGAPLPADRLWLARAAAEAGLSAGAVEALDDVMARVLAAVELEERIARVCAPGATLWDEACASAVEEDEAGQ